MREITVFHCLRDENNAITTETVAVADDLTAYQGLVGGNIEVFPLDDGLLLVCNDEGKLLGLPASVIVMALWMFLCTSGMRRTATGNLIVSTL